MRQFGYRRKTKLLLAMILLAVIYSLLLATLRTLTGITMLDGGIGILLGLYICSHPATNAVDALFQQRSTIRAFSSQWQGLQWLALNLVVLIAGWVVLVLGATRLFR